jgi:hypothetical protein
MKRTDLEHIIRAAGSIVEDSEIIVVGSQAVLGQYPDAPESLIRSMEADIYPKNKHHLSDLIDGSIGELSPFHQTFSYYAHGVGKDTVTLPNGWEQRLVPIQNDNTRGIIGWCLEIHDLLASKYVADRERDREFAAEAIRHGLVQKAQIEERILLLPVKKTLKDRFFRKIAAEFKFLSGSNKF